MAAALLIVVLGVFPGTLLDLAARSAATLFRIPGSAVSALIQP